MQRGGDGVARECRGVLLSRSVVRERSFAPHRHEGYSLSLVLAGEHRLILGEESLLVDRGAVRILHPFEMHAVARSSWEQINLSVSSSCMESLACSAGRGGLPLFPTLLRDAELEASILSVAECVGRSNREEIQRRIAELLGFLIDRHALGEAERESYRGVPPEIEEARSHIERHAHEGILRLEELARIAHLSKYHFARRFKEALGLSPYQYLQNVRIDCVRRKLSEGTSLAEAAVACGFCDQSHMIRIYKNYYAHTPAQVHPQKSKILLSFSPS